MNWVNGGEPRQSNQLLFFPFKFCLTYFGARGKSWGEIFKCVEQNSEVKYLNIEKLKSNKVVKDRSYASKHEQNVTQWSFEVKSNSWKCRFKLTTARTKRITLTHTRKPYTYTGKYRWTERQNCKNTNSDCEIFILDDKKMRDREKNFGELNKIR